MTSEEFFNQYKLKLTEQQLEAVKATNGPILLLAVPGSGKTTVLIARLGYMIYVQGIAPESILVLTYSVAATKDMTNRFVSFFGEEFSGRLRFQTINGLCQSVINHYGRLLQKPVFRLITNPNEQLTIIRNIYKNITGKFCNDAELAEVSSLITYIKNMLLSDDEIESVASTHSCDDLAEVYQAYCQYLRSNRLMDYDDQMKYCYNILSKDMNILAQYQDHYPYICVDEAQDTSKIQHLIIELLAQKYQNIFMVGDEDQSIYGFRAAWPEALLNFEKTYQNAKVLLMEMNFRSDQNIVKMANNFIQHNKNRHKKTMNAHRDPNNNVFMLRSAGTNLLYKHLANMAKENHIETAVLYRNNESAIPVVDILSRNNLSFKLKIKAINFFSGRVLSDIRSILAFAQNPSDTILFSNIYYKIKTYINKAKVQEICAEGRYARTNILASLYNDKDISEAAKFRIFKIIDLIKDLPTCNARDALDIIMYDLMYYEYLSGNTGDENNNHVNILYSLAHYENTLPDLLRRVSELEQIMNKQEFDPNSNFILSTIHGSKGLEFDRVVLIDVEDGIFPEKCPQKDMTRMSKEDHKNYQEERRLFYVGVTRAKNELYVSKTGYSVFIDEFFHKKFKSNVELIKLVESPKAQTNTDKQESVTNSKTDSDKPIYKTSASLTPSKKKASKKTKTT